MTKTKMKKKTVRRIRRTSERVELRQSHDGSRSKCGSFDSELRKLGNNPFEKLKTGGDIKTVGTLIDVLCSRNKDTKESFTKQEMKRGNTLLDSILVDKTMHDAADIYKKSIELLKREG